MHVQTVFSVISFLIQNPDVGTKDLWCSPDIYIEKMDAETLKEGTVVTLINWGNVVVTNIARSVLHDNLYLRIEDARFFCCMHL